MFAYRRLEPRLNEIREQHAVFRRNLAESITSDHIGLYFFVTYILLLAQFVGTVVILPLSWQDYCDVDLKAWLIGYLVRILVSVPVLYYQQRLLTLGGGLQRNIRNNANNFDVQHRYYQLHRVKQALRAISLIWVVLGNALIFTARTCQDSAPSLYYLSMCWVIIGYVSFVAPALVYVALMFCFPCMYAFIGRIVAAQQAEMAAALASVSDPEAGRLPAARLEELLLTLPTKPYHAGMVEAERASCIICTEAYVLEDPVRFLPCAHHFHVKCSDTWLRMKSTCPLCVRCISSTPDSSSFLLASVSALSSSSTLITSPAALSASQLPLVSSPVSSASQQHLLSSDEHELSISQAEALDDRRCHQQSENEHEHEHEHEHEQKMNVEIEMAQKHYHPPS